MDNINKPDPSRLIHGLRDTGYNMNSAAADIIDNSIAADASSINVRTVLKPTGEKFVFFGDNGHGMNPTELRNAMRYGADRRQNLKSLGKFGLGLKTASSSVCLKYSLISRDSADSALQKETWDLEHVSSVNEWQMLAEDITADEKLAFNELCGDAGTLVVWQKCDRILKNNNYAPGSTEEKSALKRVADRMAEHFALVFHKYLDPENTSYPNINITVDGEAVVFWNPFYPARAQQVLPEKLLTVPIALPEDPETTFNMGIKAWVLPHRKDMDKDEQSQFARINNRRQGFYIYREGRLIHHGGWQEIWNAAEPHYSLIRVEIDFDHELDDAFEIDVRKSRIIMNEALKDYLEKLLTGPREHANQIYRRKQKIAVTGGISHHGSNKTIAETRSIDKPTVTEVNSSGNETTVNNNRGSGIRIKAPVLNEQDPNNLCVRETENITSGNLWEPSFVSESNADYQIGVRINMHHDFYTKIYSQAGSQNSIEGMDLLLYALSAAEANNSDDELKDMWEDIREEVSGNLRRLLKSYEVPADSNEEQ